MPATTSRTSTNAVTDGETSVTFSPAICHRINGFNTLRGGRGSFSIPRFSLRLTNHTTPPPPEPAAQTPPDPLRQTHQQPGYPHPAPRSTSTLSPAAPQSPTGTPRHTQCGRGTHSRPSPPPSRDSQRPFRTHPYPPRSARVASLPWNTPQVSGAHHACRISESLDSWILVSLPPAAPTTRW